MPAFTDYSMAGRTYRYYSGTPLYPFGYGLTYGNCTVTALQASMQQAVVAVRNDSDVETEDVIELYIHDDLSPLAPLNPVLCGFQRVKLSAGEKRTVCVDIDPAAFTLVDENGKRVHGSGRWTLYAGFGAPDRRTEELTGKKNQSVMITD